MFSRCREHVKSALRYLYQFKRMYSSVKSEEDVIFENIFQRGIITLNKPKALNAINTSMVLKIYDQLVKWEDCAEMVIIKGGEKAFCSGGDIVSITKHGPKGAHLGKAFFRTEYLLNNLIGTYKIPYLALIHGITMGGGFGLSVHGQYRIATETTMFAMPETAIGLFPDVGGTFVLPRLPYKLGHFLALTGYRLKGTDVVKAGIATHFCESCKLQALLDSLITMEEPVCTLECSVFPKFMMDLSCTPFSLGTKLEKINKIFSAPTMEDIFASLEKEGSSWSISTLKDLKKMSPLSLKLTKRALEYGANKTLQECLQMENRIAAAIMDGKHSLDFYEGVRALLVDKDKKPKWNPCRLEDVTDEMIESYFEPLPCNEELTI